jgi:amino acid adenylation domain-containing protein
MSRLLQHWLVDRAQARPDANAVESQHQRLTYGELDVLSNQIGRTLKALGCRPGDRVGLLMPKSAVAVAGILGILKADAIYVPLDPSSPAARLEKVLESCESRCILAAGHVHRVLDELQRSPRPERLIIGWLDQGPPSGSGVGAAFTMEDVRRADTAGWRAENRSDDPSHILFTSGSTGVPKGVVITHANVIQVIDWAVAYFGMDASDRASQHAPFHFDLSFFDIFGTFAAGGELHIVPPELNVLPNKLVEFIRTTGLTQWFSVPSVLNYLTRFDVIAPHDFPRLRRLLWAGEVLPTPTLMHLMERLPHVQFTNLYGPTETTIFSSYYTVPARPADPQTAIPIGTPCAGEELLVLNDSMERVPAGDIGGLCIAGAGLARGYWRDPERTGAAFLSHPERPSERIYKTGDLARVGADGQFYFLGRADSQIKSRGYRIELGEIEAALNAVPGLRESAVVAVETGGFEGAVICCAYVPAGGRQMDPSSLQQQLARLIPRYMLPTRWRAFDEFPKNANGKTDRRWLKTAFAEAPVTRATQTA